MEPDVVWYGVKELGPFIALFAAFHKFVLQPYRVTQNAQNARIEKLESDHKDAVHVVDLVKARQEAAQTAKDTILDALLGGQKELRDQLGLVSKSVIRLEGQICGAKDSK